MAFLCVNIWGVIFCITVTDMKHGQRQDVQNNSPSPRFESTSQAPSERCCCRCGIPRENGKNLGRFTKDIFTVRL